MASAKGILITDLDEHLEKAEELIKLLTECEERSRTIAFITPEDLAQLTGWSLPIARKIFQEKTFPCCDAGKTKVAEVSAVKAWFSQPRKYR